MNDRFKFRAIDNREWGEEKGTIYYDAEQTYDFLGGNPSVPESSFGSLLEDDADGGWIVEQCTGLKDENGTLIYEGDIVECFYDHFDGNFTEKKVTGVVKWGVGEWSVQNEKKGDWYFLSYANYDEKHLQSDSVKVIGNIHENPELLKECKNEK